MDKLKKCGLKTQFKRQDIMDWAWREDKVLWHYSSCWTSKYIIWVKYRKGKFEINLVLIEPELMCKLYIIANIIKLTFQCNL